MPKPSWVFRNPGVTFSIAILALAVLQWAGNHALADANQPAVQKRDAEIRRISRDIRTMATFQLESARANRDVLGDLATAQGITYERPPELKDAEAAVRKLKNR